MVVLPTGYGKSLLYQATALLLDRPTVVVSPLIALIDAGAEDLARRLDVERLADERRLGTVREYAETAECRSAFQCRYFVPSRGTA